MILANFTPDKIHWMHSGVDGILKPGDITEFTDSRAKHILNKFDKRGILRLEFNDDTEEKRKRAMEIWKAFWMRQITIFNQDNERRKNTNREYADPTEDLKERADKLGIELVGPWSMKVTDNEAMRSVLNENADLKSKMAALTAQVTALAEAIRSREIPPALQTVAEKIGLSKSGSAEFPDTTVATTSGPDPKLIVEFQMLNKEKFGEWVMTNLDRIQSSEYPAGIKTMIKEKWERLIKGEFPVPL